MIPPWLALPLVVLAGDPAADRALVELEDPAVLATVGARPVGPIVGGIAVVDLPAGRREELAALPGVRQTSCSLGARRCGARLHPLLDRSLPAAGVPALRETFGSAGAGALIGVVDTGVDPTHPDLVTPEGRARVAWIADLGEAPRGVFPELEALVDAAVYGPEEVQAAIDADDASLVGGADRIGHGTHIASIAAGARGVAPDATLVVVKASRALEGTFEDADVVLASRFVFAIASELDLPAVVNLSLGGDDGGHDGGSLLERGLVASLDEEPAGRFLVAAAGNGAYRDGHAVAVLSPEASSARVTLVAPRAALPDDPALVRVAAFTTGHLAVALEPPPDADLAHASIAPRDDGGIDVLLDPAAPGHWTLVLTGFGRADLWIAETNLVGPLGSAPRFLDHVDPGGQVTLPATAEAIVAVGSYATRTEWRDPTNEAHRTPTTEERDISVFSARGPTRDGRPKPDLVAPGEAIVAALSSETDPRDASSAFHHPGADEGALVDEEHGVLWGTSAASAHVAGVAAVVLAAAPTLDATRLRSALSASTATREQKAWSVAHGWGVLDAARLAEVLADEPRRAGIDLEASLVAAVPDVVTPGETVRVLGTLRMASGTPVNEPLSDLEVLASGSTARLPIRDLGDGRFEATWTAPLAALGDEVAFDVRVAGEPLPARAAVEVAWRRDDLGAHDRLAGGGCHATPGRPRAPALLIALALALLAALGRSPFGATSGRSGRYLTARALSRYESGHVRGLRRRRVPANRHRQGRHAHPRRRRTPSRRRPDRRPVVPRPRRGRSGGRRRDHVRGGPHLG